MTSQPASVAGKNSAWLMPIALKPSSTSRLICFPYAGAGASIFRSWASLLPAHIEAFSIQSPGRETRFVEPLLTDFQSYVAQASNAIRPLCDKPITLFGHSLGAAVAYESARYLEQQGVTVELLIVSGRACPGTASRRPPISHLSDADFLRHMASYNGTPKAVLENQDLIELLLPMIRSDFALAEHYRPTPGPLLRCPLLALGSRQDEWLDPAGVDNWKALTGGSFQTQWFEGDHFYLNRYTAELVSYIAQQVSDRSV